jgi:REP element-mobilizing transposase RayT
MTRPLRIVFPGAFYHITSRGNEQKAIFKTNADRKKFLSYLQSATERYDAIIHIYCLMSNHYHLLLETPNGNLSQIMHHINGAYTTYFNVKRKRAGHLLQGRYKAILVDMDEYAKELSRYIHLNPVRAEMIDRLDQYQWSSYLDYIGKKSPPPWLSRGFILGYFGQKVSVAQKHYQEFVEAKVKQPYKNPLRKVMGSTILGSADFIKTVKEKYLQDKKEDRDLPAIRALAAKPGIEQISQITELVFGNQLQIARNAVLYLCHKYTGTNLKEIGQHFGISESGVSQASRRMAIKIGHDKKLKKQIKKIEIKLNLSKV